MTRHSRREFLQTTAAVTLGAAIGPGAQDATTPRRTTPFAVPPLDRVRIGFVGVGGQGSVHVDNLLKIEGAEVRAICDIVDWKVARAQAAVVAADQPKPAGYARGPRDFERMCAEQELDLVFTATPWEWQARRDRGARRDDGRRLLAARRHRRAAQEALRDDGELLLRPARDAGPASRATGHARRAPAWRVRVSARLARDQVLQGRRGVVAPRLVADAQRQPVSDARART